MSRFTSGLIGGIAVGLIIGASAMTDDRDRRRMKRESKRALSRAGNFIDNIKSSF